MDRHVVTAVLVAHDGARWLPETLKALLTQTRPVQRLVAVDTGSRDRGPAVLSEVVGAGNLVTLPVTTGYGEAVAEALRHPGASLDVAGSGQTSSDEASTSGGSGASPVEWIWLLHDDCAPAADALDRLLTAAETDPSIAVVGPKLRDWDDRRLLLEIGVTMDGFGRRETGVDRGELDQGQHDGRGLTDVLSVSSAGMLVRRDVWTAVGGFDRRMKLFREDIDFTWRVHAAGHRVVACSDAVLFHAEATARGLRAPEPVPADITASRLDRRNAMFVLLANLPLPAMFRGLARLVFGSLAHAARLALAKRTLAAKDELLALSDVLLSPGALLRARSARRNGRKHVYRLVRRLMAHGVWFKRLYEWLAARYSGDTYGLRQGLGEDEEPPTGPDMRPLWRILSHPPVLMTLGLTVVAVIAGRSLVAAGGHLGGGALVPPAPGAADLWHQYLAGWHPVGLGSDAGSPPYIGVLALLSTLLFGKPWLAVLVLLIGCVPVSGMTAYFAARTLVPGRHIRLPKRRAREGSRQVPAWVVRVWLATSYALLPVAAGAIAAGRLGTVVVVMLLPLAAVLVAQMFGLPRSAQETEPRAVRARRAAWGVGLLVAVMTAFVPLVWVLAVVIGVLVWVGFGQRGRGGDVAVVLGVPLALMWPWAWGLLLHPSRFLLEAGLHRGSLVDSRLSARDLVFLAPGGPGMPYWWATAALLVTAVVALPMRNRRTAILSGWMLAVFGLLAAVLVRATTVTQGSDSAKAWPGVALLFAAGGLLLAGTAAVQRAAELVAAKHLTYRIGGAAIGVVALAGPLVAAFAWMAHGVNGPVTAAGNELVPAFIGQTEAGHYQARTLVLSEDARGRVGYTLLRGAAPSLGESETPPAAAGTHHLDTLVAELVTGHGDGPALARMGIGYVYVPHPGRDPLVPTLDAAPDLARLGRSNGFALWQLTEPAGRLMLVDGGTVTPLSARIRGASVVVPPGAAGRTLLLAEPDDGGWSATLDGKGLTGRRADGWAVQYAVPASGGRFELAHSMLGRHIWLVLQALLLAAVAILALPAGRLAQAEHAAVQRGRLGRARRRASASGSRQVVELQVKAAEAGAVLSAKAGAAARSGARSAARSFRHAAEQRRARRGGAQPLPPETEEEPIPPGEPDIEAAGTLTPEPEEPAAVLAAPTEEISWTSALDEPAYPSALTPTTPEALTPEDQAPDPHDPDPYDPDPYGSTTSGSYPTAPYASDSYPALPYGSTGSTGSYGAEDTDPGSRTYDPDEAVPAAESEPYALEETEPYVSDDEAWRSAIAAEDGEPYVPGSWRSALAEDAESPSTSSSSSTGPWQAEPDDSEPSATDEEPTSFWHSADPYTSGTWEPTSGPYAATPDDEPEPAAAPDPHTPEPAQDDPDPYVPGRATPEPGTYVPEPAPYVPDQSSREPDPYTAGHASADPDPYVAGRTSTGPDPYVPDQVSSESDAYAAWRGSIEPDPEVPQVAPYVPGQASGEPDPYVPETAPYASEPYVPQVAPYAPERASSEPGPYVPGQASGEREPYGGGDTGPLPVDADAADDARRPAAEEGRDGEPARRGKRGRGKRGRAEDGVGRIARAMKARAKETRAKLSRSDEDDGGVMWEGEVAADESWLESLSNEETEQPSAEPRKTTALEPGLRIGSGLSAYGTEPRKPPTPPYGTETGSTTPHGSNAAGSSSFGSDAAGSSSFGSGAEGSSGGGSAFGWGGDEPAAGSGERRYGGWLEDGERTAKPAGGWLEADDDPLGFGPEAAQEAGAEEWTAPGSADGPAGDGTGKAKGNRWWEQEDGR